MGTAQKKCNGFLSSLIGYVVIIVFLLMVGLFVWIFPGDMNLLDKGYADMDSLFLIAPWVFLFLVPAVTMRSFAEEKRTGTIELLLTKPLSTLQLILAKFLSGWFLTLIAILPTIIYYVTIYRLADPVGNVDQGGILGSFIGLSLLSAVFVSIGIFASSLTENQIVAFISAVFMCFFHLHRFREHRIIRSAGPVGDLMIKLGINEHYRPSISQGVRDTRDVAYFVGVCAIFIFLCKSVIESRKW